MIGLVAALRPRIGAEGSCVLAYAAQPWAGGLSEVDAVGEERPADHVWPSCSPPNGRRAPARPALTAANPVRDQQVDWRRRVHRVRGRADRQRSFAPSIPKRGEAARARA
jgi:hypothetical protein